MNRILPILVLLATARFAAGQQTIDFEKTIRPILQKHCSECHGAKTQKSGLRLDARHGFIKGGDSGPVVVAGKNTESELVRRIVSTSSDDKMPPEGPAVGPDEITLIQRWIDAGAEWPETDYDREAAIDPRLRHWSFQPLQPVAVPDVLEREAVPGRQLNEIDRFIVAKLQEHELSFSAPADRRTLIRRATFDMTGLPATPERIAQFINDDSPKAWPNLVEELLASPHYGERWAQHWLDVIRYADTHGFEVNTPRDNAWHYRDYVIRALNEDKPYDQFVREQLAGDVFNADAATGFMVASAVLLPGQIGADDVSKRLARQDALDEIIVGTSSTMLGLTIGCARCHDHKFDPITAHDYYSLQAYFAGVEYGDRPLRDADFEKKKSQATELTTKIAKLQNQLQSYEPIARSGRTLLLDEENKAVVTYLKQENGPGTNPAGTKPGYKDETGTLDRLSNISQGRYTWWNNVPGEDVMTYNPGVTGRFQLWLSWGAHGSGVHTRDARYVLDQDGDLTTREDQTELARIDQYYLANVTEGQTEQVPLWSGLKSVGELNLSEGAKIILRGGDTGTGITADVVVLQEIMDEGKHPMNNLPGLRAPVSPLQNVEHFLPVMARFVRFTTFETINNNQHEPCLDELEIYSGKAPGKNLALASSGVKPSSSGNYSDIGIHQLPHINDGLYGNDHSWISNQQGGGWVQLELPEATEIDRVVWGRDRNGKFPDRLPVRYEISTSLDGQTWTTVARQEDRVPMGAPFDAVQALVRSQPADTPANLSELVSELETLRSQKTALENPAMVFGGTFREPDMTYVLRRGDPEQKMDPTTPAIPVVFKKANGNTAESASNDVTLPGNNTSGDTSTLTAEQQRRLNLANWIASPNNPLTARVMVNRIWLNHFGRGLVDTPSDFGVNGAKPSHPELLDWLAAEFIRSGWSIKHMHRLIMNSATYQQSSLIDSKAADIDRDNTLLWRFTSRRMESESIRDCLLSVSGELNLQMGGPGFSFFKTRGGLDGFPPLEEFTPNEMRRMIYSHKVRMEQVPVFGAFDCPDAGQSMPRRGRSTTAIQALNLFNSPFVNDRAEKFAARVIAAGATSPVAQVDSAFEITLGRKPSETEKIAAEAVVSEHGLATLCRVLFNSSEFLFIP
jgi:cytochrome c553